MLSALPSVVKTQFFELPSCLKVNQLIQSLCLIVWMLFYFCVNEPLAVEVKNQHYSLYPSLDKQTKVTASKIITKSTSTTLDLTAVAATVDTSPRSDWLPKNSVSRMPSSPYLSFVRYERNVLAYRPYFEDILYFSCEAWIPNYLDEVPKVLSAKKARSILTEYFVVPQAEWHNSYPKSGSFTHYARVKFPENIKPFFSNLSFNLLFTSYLCLCLSNIDFDL